MSINTNGDGGSAVTIGGTLTNTGTFSIGNSGLSASTTVTAQTLTNSGSIALAGSSGNLAELVVNGLATTAGALAIGAGAELDVTGSHVFTQAGGSTTVTGSLVANTIDANAGKLDFKSVITSGDGVGALNIGSAGTLEFDKAVDATHHVKFAAAGGGTLALGEPGGFKGTVSSFAVSDAIDLLGKGITSLAYSGSSASGILTVDGSSGAIAHLSFDGDYTRSSFTFASDGHGGSVILQTTDIWTGTGNWASDPSNWSTGAPPAAADTAEIQAAESICTLTTAATAGEVIVDGCEGRIGPHWQRRRVDDDD